MGSGHRLRSEARSLLAHLLSGSRSDQYARHTLVRLAIDDLRELLEQEEATDQDIDDAIRRVERVLKDARQQYPNDYYLHRAEADFSRLLEDHKRSLRALEAAFETNPRDPYIATRLSHVYEDNGNLQAAEACLRRALENNRGNKQLHFRYAHVLRVIDASAVDKLAYHFRRAFTEWDHNYEAQFWYARYIFESRRSEDVREAKQIFKRLRNVPMEHYARTKVRDYMMDSGHPKLFTGTISRVEMAYGFVTIDGRGEDIFFHKSDISDATWYKLQPRSRIRFNVGFTFRGPVALQIESG